MTSSKRSESDWQGLVNEVSAALLKHDSDDDDDDDDVSIWHCIANHLNSTKIHNIQAFDTLHKIKCALVARFNAVVAV